MRKQDERISGCGQRWQEIARPPTEREIAEVALAHTLRHKTEAAYQAAICSTNDAGSWRSESGTASKRPVASESGDVAAMRR